MGKVVESEAACPHRTCARIPIPALGRSSDSVGGSRRSITRGLLTPEFERHAARPRRSYPHSSRRRNHLDYRYFDSLCPRGHWSLRDGLPNDRRRPSRECLAVIVNGCVRRFSTRKSGDHRHKRIDTAAASGNSVRVRGQRLPSIEPGARSAKLVLARRSAPAFFDTKCQ